MPDFLIAAADRSRFEALVDRSQGLGPEGECHEWRGLLDPRGVGRLGFQGNRSRLAHRVAWLLEHGSWPTAPVRRRCENLACVRGSHLTTEPRPMPTLAERFEAKVARGDGCHLWTGGRQGEGYGAISVDGKPRLAHHVAWFLATGEWPSLFVLHHCDTPPCVRHDHLFLGTQADNMADMHAKGRRVYA